MIKLCLFNKKHFFSFAVLFFIILLLTCINFKSKRISFYGSGSFCLNDVNLNTEGYTSFGQYKYVGIGYTTGGSAGSETYSFKSGPKGEVIAIWRTFLENNKNELIKSSEKIYYAYTSKPNFEKSNQLFFKNNLNIYLSYGSLFLYEEYVPKEKRKNENLYINKHGVKKYLFGEQDFFYYSLQQNTQGKYYSIPFDRYYKIKAIRITKEQFNFFYDKYRLYNKRFYLDKAPNVTIKQLNYMKKNGRKLSK